MNCVDRAETNFLYSKIYAVLPNNEVPLYTRRFTLYFQTEVPRCEAGFIMYYYTCKCFFVFSFSPERHNCNIKTNFTGGKQTVV